VAEAIDKKSLFIYHATCKTRAGYQAALVPGREYVFFGTPLHAEGGVVVEPEN